MNFSAQIPEGDNRARNVCDTCGFIDYVNPRIVAGAIVQHEDLILLCRRAIEPRKGFWTIPAGYMEEHETAEHAACRETMEEACADIALDGLLAVYSIPRLSQVRIIFRARLNGGYFAPGPESLEVALFRMDEIPWAELAFPSVHWALNHFAQIRGRASFAAFSNPAGELGDMPSR